MLKQAGTIVGRKKLQKLVFISKKFHFDFQERYNFHYYGPYSEELSLKIEELTNLGVIQETKEDKGSYVQYKYELSSLGEEYLEQFPIELQGYKPFIQTLNQESSRFLELISTILYFDRLTKEELIEKIKKVKSNQNYSVDEIERGLQLINSLEAKYIEIESIQ